MNIIQVSIIITLFLLLFLLFVMYILYLKRYKKKNIPITENRLLDAMYLLIFLIFIIASIIKHYINA